MPCGLQKQPDASHPTYSKPHSSSSIFILCCQLNNAPCTVATYLQVITYAVVEIEKALVDPVLMPVVRPVLEFLEDITPNWLRIPQNRVSLWKGCKKPQGPPAVKHSD